jgi:RNA polymerase sigma-70 factor (ECF subfamily)
MLGDLLGDLIGGIGPCPGTSPDRPSLARLLAGAEPAFRDALTESFAGLELCDHNLLRFHYFHGLSVDRLAEVLCTSRGAVTRQLARIRARLLRDTRRHLAARLRLTRDELDRLIDVARDRLDRMIARILHAPPAWPSWRRPAL